jgi:hypothetical protein
LKRTRFSYPLKMNIVLSIGVTMQSEPVALVSIILN